VKIRSPGSRGHTAESRAMSSGTAKIMSRLRAFCSISSSMEQDSSRSPGSATSSVVTRSRPTHVPTVASGASRECGVGGEAGNQRRRRSAENRGRFIVGQLRAVFDVLPAPTARSRRRYG
jgi:hypothetical protein